MAGHSLEEPGASQGGGRVCNVCASDADHPLVSSSCTLRLPPSHSIHFSYVMTEVMFAVARFVFYFGKKTLKSVLRVGEIPTGPRNSELKSWISG